MVDAVGTLRWIEGEREAFRADLLPDDMRYYVDEAVIAPFRVDPSAVSRDAWIGLFERGGFYVNVGVAYAPTELALDALQRRMDTDRESIWSLKGALAVLGAQVIPIAIRSLQRAVGNIGNGVFANQIQIALEDIAPIEASELVELVARVLGSKAGTRAKHKAKAWVIRHHAIVSPLLPTMMASANAPAGAKAAARALAAAGVVEVVGKTVKRRS